MWDCIYSHLRSIYYLRTLCWNLQILCGIVYLWFMSILVWLQGHPFINVIYVNFSKMLHLEFIFNHLMSYWIRRVSILDFCWMFYYVLCSVRVGNSFAKILNLATHKFRNSVYFFIISPNYPSILPLSPIDITSIYLEN